MISGERIKNRRNELGLTMYEVSRKIGVRDATLSRYESGEIRSVRYDTMIALAQVLCTTPAYLMGEDNEKLADEKAEEISKLFNSLSTEKKREALRYLRYLANLKADD